MARRVTIGVNQGPNRLPAIGYGAYESAIPPTGMMIGQTPYVAPSAVPILANQTRMQQLQLGTPQAPAAPQAPSQSSLLKALYADPRSARGQALQAAASTGLQLSGYQDRPMTTGQILGAMMQSGMGAYQQAEEKKRQEDLLSQQREIEAQQRATDIKLKLMEIDAAKAAAGRAATEKAFTQEAGLRKEFVTQSKDFTEAKLGFEKVQNAALAKAPSGATDIALVFGYMKVLDPNSVVREGEFATAANAGGVGEYIRNYYNRLLEGTLLTPKVRGQFIDSARTQFEPYLVQQEAREDSFIKLAESYDLDESRVVESKLPDMGSLARPYNVTTEAEAEDLPKGSYVMINGRLARIK